MKKIIALLLFVCTLVSIAACGGEKPEVTTVTTVTTSTTSPLPTEPDELEAEALIAEAIEKIKNTDSFKINTTALIVMSASGVKTETKLVSDFTVSGATTQKPVWRENATTTAVGEEETQNVFFKDGFYYVDAYGFKAKIKKDDAATNAFTPIGGDLEKIVKALSFDAITKVTVLNSGKIKITADPMDEATISTVFEDFISEIETSFTESFKTESNTVTFSADNGTAEIIIGADGALLEYHVFFDTKFAITDVSTGEQQDLDIGISYGLIFSEHGEAEVEELGSAANEYVSTSITGYPFALVSDAFFAANKLPDLDVSTSTSITMNMGGVSVWLEMNGNFTAKDYFSTTPIWKETVYLSTAYDKQATTVYFADGYYYIDSNGQKLKLSKAEYEALYGKDTKTDIVLLPGNISFENSEVYWDEEAKLRTVTFYAESDDFKKVFAAHVESALTLIMGSTSAVSAYEVYYPEVSLTVTQDGKVESYDFAYYLDIVGVVNGAQVSVQALVEESLHFNSFGEEVTVTPPSGYQDFPTLGDNA
ncbi:MAG: hypothetical protein IJX55_06515 [Clostridia bacterium]|nr:hypothetical protein [Clostridia bacterium]